MAVIVEKVGVSNGGYGFGASLGKSNPGTLVTNKGTITATNKGPNANLVAVGDKRHYPWHLTVKVADNSGFPNNSGDIELAHDGRAAVGGSQVTNIVVYNKNGNSAPVTATQS